MTKFLVDAKELKTVIETMLPFVSKEETRYYLGGLYFHGNPKDGHIKISATDGHKLCAMTLACNLADNESHTLDNILPEKAARTALLVLKSAIKFDVPILLDIYSGRVCIDSSEQKATFVCIDGTFPDYTKVIPKDEPKFSIGLMKEQAIEATKAIKAHKGEAMRWEFTDAHSPVKLVSDGKVVVIMPCRESITESVF